MEVDTFKAFFLKLKIGKLDEILEKKPFFSEDKKIADPPKPERLSDLSYATKSAVECRCVQVLYCTSNGVYCTVIWTVQYRPKNQNIYFTKSQHSSYFKFHAGFQATDKCTKIVLESADPYLPDRVDFKHTSSLILRQDMLFI